MSRAKKIPRAIEEFAKVKETLKLYAKILIESDEKDRTIKDTIRRIRNKSDRLIKPFLDKYTQFDPYFIYNNSVKVNCYCSSPPHPIIKLNLDKFIADIKPYLYEMLKDMYKNLKDKRIKRLLSLERETIFSSQSKNYPKLNPEEKAIIKELGEYFPFGYDANKEIPEIKKLNFLSQNRLEEVIISLSSKGFSNEFITGMRMSYQPKKIEEHKTLKQEIQKGISKGISEEDKTYSLEILKVIGIKDETAIKIANKYPTEKIDDMYKKLEDIAGIQLAEKILQTNNDLLLLDSPKYYLYLRLLKTAKARIGFEEINDKKNSIEYNTPLFSSIESLEGLLTEIKNTTSQNIDILEDIERYEQKGIIVEKEDLMKIKNIMYTNPNGTEAIRRLTPILKKYDLYIEMTGTNHPGIYATIDGKRRVISTIAGSPSEVRTGINTFKNLKKALKDAGYILNDRNIH